MSTMLERPTPRTAVSDLRGSAPVPVPGSVLADPTGRRRRVLTRVGRAIALLFVGWMAVLVLGGVGVLPAPGLPGSSVFRASSGPPSLPDRAPRPDRGHRTVAVTASAIGTPAVVPGPARAAGLDHADDREGAMPARRATRATGGRRDDAASGRRTTSAGTGRTTRPAPTRRPRPAGAPRPAADPRPAGGGGSVAASSTGPVTASSAPTGTTATTPATPASGTTTTTSTPPTTTTPTSPGSSGTAPGRTTDPGSSGTAPGRTTSPGQSGSSPGHTSDPTTTTPSA